MNDIISKVTPLTRGIIWLPQGEPQASSPAYKAVDYLLNGLLTAGLPASGTGSSRVIMSTSFGRPMYVFVVRELVQSEYESFLNLLKKDLTEENSVLVIDETDAFPALQKLSPVDIRPRLHLIK